MISDPEFEHDAGAAPTLDPTHDTSDTSLAPRKILSGTSPRRERAEVKRTSTFR